MILPSKHLSQERALLTVGAKMLAHLERPMTVSSLWQAVQRDTTVALTFDWFILALDLLYLLGATHLYEGTLVRGCAHDPDRVRQAP